MPCTGNPSCNQYEPDSGLCYDCGCEWDFGMCYGDPYACSSHSTQFPCENCLCNWSEPSTNIKINIGDVFKDVESLQINIGNVWKNVTLVQINIGNVWKTVFSI